MVILELIHALKPNSVEGLCLLVTELTQAPPGLLVIHNNRTDRMAPAGEYFPAMVNPAKTFPSARLSREEACRALGT